MTVLRQSSALFRRNLQICDLWINHKNLLICDFWTNSPRKFADMRLRNERKNLRICNLRTLKISLLVHLWKKYFQALATPGSARPAASLKDLATSLQPSSCRLTSRSPATASGSFLTNISVLCR
jgi:hypothetical protein